MALILQNQTESFNYQTIVSVYWYNQLRAKYEVLVQNN